MYLNNKCFLKKFFFEDLFQLELKTSSFYQLEVKAKNPQNTKIYIDDYIKYLTAK